MAPPTHHRVTEPHAHAVPAGMDVRGLRASEANRAIERLVRAPWFDGPSGAELARSAAPVVEELTRTIGQGACLPPRLRLLRTLTEASDHVLTHRRSRALARAIAADGAARARALACAPEGLGSDALQAGWRAACAVVQRLATPLFRRSLHDHCADLEGVLRHVRQTTPLRCARVERTAEIVELLGAPLATALPGMIVASWGRPAATADQDLSIRSDQALHRLIEVLVDAAGDDLGSEHDLAVATAILSAAWQPACCILELAALAMSRHVGDLVLRPQSPADLWSPWARLFELGAPVVGFGDRSSLALLDYHPASGAGEPA